MAKEANKTTVIALLVVAGILLFLVGSYTGQSIFSKQPNLGKGLNLQQKQDVLNMLNKCIVVDVGTGAVDTQLGWTCNNWCSEWSKVCIIGYSNKEDVTQPEYSRPLACGDGGVGVRSLHCVCCNP